MRPEVERRAQGRCEYCRAPQSVCAYTFHLEHIIPRSKGGVDAVPNLALSCFWCNSKKSAHQEAIDPQSGRRAALFHPRSQRWNVHFALSSDGLRIEGKTASGRATVSLFEMNSARRRNARLLWLRIGIWP
jgi:hypothetical protein